jgi:hypothetical protein
VAALEVFVLEHRYRLLLEILMLLLSGLAALAALPM